MTEEEGLMSVRMEMTRIDVGKIIADVVVVMSWTYLGQSGKLKRCLGERGICSVQATHRKYRCNAGEAKLVAARRFLYTRD